MKKVNLGIIFIVLILFSSCARNIYADYQTESQNTGTIVVKPSKSTEKTFVTINDNLIVDKKNVKSVTLNNVPKGSYNIHYTSESGWYKETINDNIKVDMTEGKKVTKIVEIPPYSTGYWIYNAAIYTVVFGVMFFSVM